MLDEERVFLDAIDDFLARPDVDELIALHPNLTVTADFVLPERWRSWWDWAGEVPWSAADDTEAKWRLLWRYYMHDCPSESEDAFARIPAYLRGLLRDARRLQISRIQGQEASVYGERSHDPASFDLPTVDVNLPGMSPKKTHEVQCMTKCSSALLGELASKGTRVHHVVDVGAGQAYLSRALRDECHLDVLALDWSSVQEEGAARREQNRDRTKKKKAKQSTAVDAGLPGTGTLCYRKIAITTDTLVTAADEWISQSNTEGRGCLSYTPSAHGSSGVPVFLVALHACGSLTLDILRAVIRQSLEERTDSWFAAGGLIVGCCYNLLRPEDWISQTGRKLRLSANHLQLAAQVPSQWGRTATALKDTALAFRKMSWRALLGGLLFQQNREKPMENGSAPQLKRLGRLSDSVYQDWAVFLAVVEEKLDVKVTGKAFRDPVLESRLEVLHLLRCVLGPVIESFLLLDRKLWLQERLQAVGMQVRLVNLFDQSSGSARNVGIVLVPN